MSWVKQMHMFRISDILDKYEQVATAGFAGAWKNDDVNHTCALLSQMPRMQLKFPRSLIDLLTLFCRQCPPNCNVSAHVSKRE